MQSQVVAQPSFENVSVWGDHKLDLKQDPVKIFNSFWFLYFLEKKFSTYHAVNLFVMFCGYHFYTNAKTERHSLMFSHY